MYKLYVFVRSYRNRMEVKDLRHKSNDSNNDSTILKGSMTFSDTQFIDKSW